MRILVVSTLYPPVAFGGYEVECSAVVERLRERHEVLVLTSSSGDVSSGADSPSLAGADPSSPTGAYPSSPTGADPAFSSGADGRVEVRRELTRLTPDWRGALRAPLASLRAVSAVRSALAWEPDLVYCWNGAAIPQAVLRVLADSGVPIAFRVCEHWFAGLFAKDQFLRELLPAGGGAGPVAGVGSGPVAGVEDGAGVRARRSPGRRVWAGICRAFNALPALRLDPLAPFPAAISWNAQTLREMVPTPSFLQPVLERVGHSVPRHGDLYAAMGRAPAAEPEIVFLGRVTPYKGLSVAIEALAQLRSRHDLRARLRVVGPEDVAHAAEMRLLAERLGVAGAVEWCGQASPEQAAAALARAHALIVPSVWEEPFPLVTIEGALARVPLVASDVGGIAEGMHDQEHALLFARGDAAGAAAALARVLRDEGGETRARVERAYERAQEFRIGPYLDAQESFVEDAYAALREVSRRAPSLRGA